MEFSCDPIDSDGEIPEVNLTINIQPYMYEPMTSQNQTDDDISLEPSDSDEDEEELLQNPSQHLEPSEPIGDWCTCGNCIHMETPRENERCRHTNIVDGKMEEDGLQQWRSNSFCIVVNCLNRHVLETSYYEYLQENGPLEKNELIHEYVYQRLGKNNRRILPSCVVTKIRTVFPSQQYCGFKYLNSK
ncbi:hypothetical protein ACJMK2_012589 [Sinanodonta woodiana]|uniref:P2X purinoreceptor 7 intracellular domain-containing protein n=1 Tax=Sinanodonta woodiana TaxID=1069815 RepID=A0ABD3VBP8_SINWO